MAELVFPFRNLTYHTLINFVDLEKVYDFSDSNLKIDEWAEKDYEVELFQNSIPDFENELLQVIQTTSEDTINYYFESLSSIIENIQSLLQFSIFLDETNKINQKN